jgi:hypothetical protein
MIKIKMVYFNLNNFVKLFKDYMLILQNNKCI